MSAAGQDNPPTPTPADVYRAVQSLFAPHQPQTPSRAAYLSAAAAPPPNAATLDGVDGSAGNSTNGTELTEIEQMRTPYIPGAPNASWPTAYAAIWGSNKGIAIPQGFLATSHEWKRMTDYGGDNVQAFANIFKMLAARPVLRIGGSSQDLMTELPGPETWTALKRLHQASNCR